MKKIALLFPGQGSQDLGMEKYLCDTYEVAKRVFEEASDNIGIDIVKMCNDVGLEELTKTENAQVAIFTTSIATYKAYIEVIGVKPQYAAGHSLGEITALTCAGVIDFKDAIKLVQKRGIFMQKSADSCNGGMLAISDLDIKLIEKESKELSDEDKFINISNLNAPNQVVVSGDIDTLNKLIDRVEYLGGRAKKLKVSSAFHSRMMIKASEEFSEELKKYKYNKFEYPVISNVTARPYRSSNEVVTRLKEQIVSQVRWHETMQFLKKNCVELAIELGPKNVLTNINRRNGLNIVTCSSESEKNFINIKENIDRLVSTRGDKETVLSRCLSIAICTCNHNNDNDEYNKGVLEPYLKIQQLQEKLEAEDKEPTFDEMIEGIKMLKSVFKTKGTPIEEQLERFNEILDESDTRVLFQDISYDSI